MEFKELIKKRRSIRKYTGEAIAEEKLENILEAGLLAFSGRNLKPWEFILVRDKAVLEKLSHAKDSGSAMLSGADAAIVVIADMQSTDVWTEDCSVAMTYMHLMACNEGVGSCWIQCRLRVDEEGKGTEDYVRKVLDIPKGYAVEAMLSLGMADGQVSPRTVSEDDFNKIHRGEF